MGTAVKPEHALAHSEAPLEVTGLSLSAMGTRASLLASLDAHTVENQSRCRSQDARKPVLKARATDAVDIP